MRSAAGMIVAVTRPLLMSSPLMSRAAMSNSFFVFRIRASSTSFSLAPSPFTSGITATPVSKPERPSASLGNNRSASIDTIPWDRLLREEILPLLAARYSSG